MTRSVNPAPQFLDGNGDPLDGGKMYFFESGTSTPKTTFSDVSETVPNEHPVTLDGDGRLPPVFFSGSAKQRLNEAGGTLVFERDPVGAESILGAFTDYNALLVYSTDDIVNDQGLFYKSLVNNNQNNTPASSPTFWEEIRFISVYNANVNYSTGDIAQTATKGLWRSVIDGNINNNPDDDDGTKWVAATSPPSIQQSGGGPLVAYQINQLKDAGTYSLPLANTVPSGGWVEVELSDADKTNQPTVQRSGSDTITDSDGSDTDVLFDATTSISLRFVSDGVSNWEI